MAIITCPECSKKLKVADTSIGKKVKCSCTAVFLAESADEPAPAKAEGTNGAAMAEKVLVACTECGAKLKVAPASLGKKMKCPKCAGVFVAASSEMEKAKAKPAPAEDEDDLAAFAAAEAKTAADDDDWQDMDEEAKPKPKPKAKPRKPIVQDDEEEEVGEAPAGKPVYPSRLGVNLLVLFLVVGYVVFLALAHPAIGVVDLGLTRKTASQPISTKGGKKADVPPPILNKGGPGPIKKKKTEPTEDKQTRNGRPVEGRTPRSERAAVEEPVHHHSRAFRCFASICRSPRSA